MVHHPSGRALGGDADAIFGFVTLDTLVQRRSSSAECLKHAFMRFRRVRIVGEFGLVLIRLCEHGQELLLTVLAKPYQDQPEFSHYADPPEPHERVLETFCGT